MKTIRFSLMLLCLAPMISAAHHSFAGFYDADQIVEIEGIVKSVSWRNPHGSLTIDVTDESGETTVWQIETGSISVLRIRGLDREFVRVGDRVRIAGEAALRREAGLYARNMLLPSGEEVMLSIGIAPRWTDPETGELLEPQYDSGVIKAAKREANGIFRVWSTVLDDPESFPLFKGGYPLTEEAEQIKSGWDASNVVLLGCEPKGMPSLMITPYPIEFVDHGETILIRFEEDNAERVIHMAPDADPSTAEPSLLGFSTGRWDGDTLIVKTTNVNAPYFDSDGTPQSSDANFTEYFSLNAGQDRIDYRLVIDDPATFTETFALPRYWVWRPELTVEYYDCVAER